MATPVWNQLAAPNYSAANELIAQAMSQLTKAGEGLQGVAKEYKDTIQKRNLGLIQEYVNSAKTPEELQSEAFKTGLANLTGGMGGDYDTLAKAQLVDKAYDSLLSRKANQVSIASNEFGLTQKQLEANQKQAISNIFATNDPTMRQAIKEQAVKDKVFDSSLYLQTLAAELTGKTNQQTYDYNAETWNTRKEALTLGNDAIRNRMKNDDRAAATAEKNAQANMLQAEAAAAKAEAERRAKQNEKNPALTLLSAIDKIDAAYNSDLLKPSSDPNVADSLETWWKGKNSYVRSNTDIDNIKTILSTDPKTAKLPGKQQVAIAEIAYTTIMNENALGRNVFNTGSATEQAEKAVKAAIDKVETQKNDYLYSQKIPEYRRAVRDQMIQTGERDPVKAASQVGMDEYEMYRTNIRTDLQTMAESVYESSGSTLPKEQFVDKFIYNTVNKKPVDDLIKPKISKAAPSETIKFNSPAMQMAGFADYGTAFRFEEREAEKAAQQLKASAKANQAQTGNSLQEQQQRMEAAALARLTAAALKQNGQPPVTPTITAKPEEFKPRELTPAEKQQAERMNQAALSRLTGAKLEEKQALVRNAFPNASLTPINKATEPLSNNSIPLIQSMFKLPVITDTPKAITTEAKQIKQSVFTDTSLKVLANAVKPVPSPLVPVESQNAFKSRDNNLSINLSTGKSVPSKDPVPMPNVSWGKPVEVVTMNPIVAKLPQYKAVATFVEDGDTFKATSKQYATKGTKANGNVLCRVDSVDAPETPHPPYKKGQPYGEEAAKKLQQMILNKEISIRIVRAANGDPNEPGLYGRDICQIEVEGANVSTELIRAGAAWLYREYNYYFTGLETVEANAKAEGRGLFSDPNAVYPQTAKHNGSLKLR